MIVLRADLAPRDRRSQADVSRHARADRLRRRCGRRRHPVGEGQERSFRDAAKRDPEFAVAWDRAREEVLGRVERAMVPPIRCVMTPRRLA